MANEFSPILQDPINRMTDLENERNVDYSKGTLFKGAAEIGDEVIKQATVFNDQRILTQTVEGVQDILSSPTGDELSPADKQVINGVSDRAMRLRAAADQGRIDLNTRAEAFVKEQIARRPDLATKIRTAVKTNLGYDFNAVNERIINKQIDAQLKPLERASDAGAIVYNDDGSINQELTTANGVRLLQQDEALKNFDAKKNLQVGNQTGALVEDIFTRMEMVMPNLDKAFSRMDVNNATPEQIAMFQGELAKQASAMEGQLRREYAMAGFRPEAIDKAMEQYQAYTKSYLSFFEGDLKQKQDFLKRMETTAGIKLYEASPMLANLKAVGGDQAVSAFISAHVFSDAATNTREGTAVRNLLTGKSNTATFVEGGNDYADGVRTNGANVTQLATTDRRRAQQLGKVALSSLNKLKDTQAKFDDSSKKVFVADTMMLLNAAQSSGIETDLTNTSSAMDSKWRAKVRGEILTTPNMDVEELGTKVAGISASVIKAEGSKLLNSVNSSVFQIEINPTTGKLELQDLSGNLPRPNNEGVGMVGWQMGYSAGFANERNAIQKRINAINNAADNLVMFKEYTDVPTANDVEIKQFYLRSVFGDESMEAPGTSRGVTEDTRPDVDEATGLPIIYLD